MTLTHGGNGLRFRSALIFTAFCRFDHASVKRVDCDKTEEKSVKIFIPYEISFILVS